MIININDYLTVAQAADHAGVTEKTIYNWIKRGVIETVTLMGKTAIHKGQLVSKDARK